MSWHTSAVPSKTRNVSQKKTKDGTWIVDVYQRVFRRSEGSNMSAVLIHASTRQCSQPLEIPRGHRSTDPPFQWVRINQLVFRNLHRDWHVFLFSRGQVLEQRAHKKWILTIWNLRRKSPPHSCIFLPDTPLFRGTNLCLILWECAARSWKPYTLFQSKIYDFPYPMGW